jgi:hypothetical protein
MNTKHTATAHGHTWTRSSQNKVYTHMVIGKKLVSEARKDAEKQARSKWRMDLDYTKLLAASDGKIYSTFRDGSPCIYDVTPERIARAKAELEGGEEGYVAVRLAEHDAGNADAWKTEDGQYLVWSQGWCSRLDLAMKLASRTQGGEIVEAVITK